jgi:hypothetical protein
MKMLTTFGKSISGNTGMKPLSLSRLGTTFQFPRRAAAQWFQMGETRQKKFTYSDFTNFSN